MRALTDHFHVDLTPGARFLGLPGLLGPVEPHGYLGPAPYAD